MHPRISVRTLGVDDLERSLVFYRDGLGLREDLAYEARVALSTRSSTEFTIGS